MSSVRQNLKLASPAIARLNTWQRGSRNRDALTFVNLDRGQKVQGDGERTFVIGSDGASATGQPNEHGFLVKKGSIARLQVSPSGVDRIRPRRDQLVAEGVLEELDSGLRFTRDFLFDSPSGAASVVQGRHSNGWTEWKTSIGETLSQVMRLSRNGNTPILSESLKSTILARHEQLLADGKLPTKSDLAKSYGLFRKRFGPEVLSALDGEELLNVMHDHGNHDSLVYWLEFKDDDEFVTRQFGSIAGGSALKFRVFRSKETGTWRAGSKKGNKPEDITLEEAIEYARQHRDQLVRGCELLANLPENASDEEYAELQDNLDEYAPDVSRLAWGHKYFSLLFPEKLDDYHSPQWQRYILLKLQQLPPQGEGRYICAGRLIAAAREVGLPIVTMDTVLNSIYGSLHSYWRIGTRSGDTNESHWEMMQTESCVAIGWRKVGDLSWCEASKASKDKLATKLNDLYKRGSQSAGGAASQIHNFLFGIKEGDIVVAADDATVLGVGKIVGDYEFKEGLGFPNHRKVEWIDLEPWKMPVPEGLRSTVRKIHRHNENLLEIERRIQEGGRNPMPTPNPTPTKQPPRLTGIPGRIQSTLERKGQVILYGPPGTGKTYWAERSARDLAAYAAFGRAFDQLEKAMQLDVIGGEGKTGYVRMCCFHPAYGYEDFLEGYRPLTVDGQMSFQLRDGVFKQLCHDANASPDKAFYLIVDEINRGDIPRIFGELLTTLEVDKRGRQVILPVSQQAFTVPKNVFLIGTMNTADRSISLLDAALRRRFGFVEMMPDANVLKDGAVAGIPLKAWFEALNARIRAHVGRDARNLQIGHSYLMHGGRPFNDFAAFKRAIRDDIIPLLEEYCYEDFATLAEILGKQLVDVQYQRFAAEMFEDGQESDLVQALLAPCPEILASSTAVSLEEKEEEDAADEFDENGEGEESL